MIRVPSLILDEARCRANIRAMAEKSRALRLKLRPHFKTHQSLDIGRWFADEGVECITVSSVGMAKYFAPAWNDITIAFPVNLREIEDINSLAEVISINLLVESTETINFLNSNLSHHVNVFIKINLGNNRAGLKPDNHEYISKLANDIHKSEKMNFLGFLGHAGQTYGCRSATEIRNTHRIARTQLVELKEKYKDSYPNIQASYGDTPSSSVCDDFEGIDEIRPGNFVFYDLMQSQIGSCTPGQIAVALACPVVAIHPEDNEIILYGGGIHLSKDRLTTVKGDVFGQAVKCGTNGLGSIIDDCYLISLSQEHGVLRASPEFIRTCKVGDLVHILPVHSCMTANLMKSYRTTNGKTISMFTPY